MKMTKNPVFLHFFSKFMGILLFVLKYMYISLLLKMINGFSWPAKIMVSPFKWNVIVRLRFVICAAIDILESKKAPRFLIVWDGLMQESPIDKASGIVFNNNLMQRRRILFLSHLISIYSHSSNFWYRWYNFVILKVCWKLDEKVHIIVYHQHRHDNWLDRDMQYPQLVKYKYCN